MTDKIRCPYCSKLNEMDHKFCVYCGSKLPKENVKLEIYCPKCEKTIEKNQTQCECGYRFEDITCLKCNALNNYTNTFCIKCGEELPIGKERFNLIADKNIYCPKCEKIIEKDQTQCECGYRFEKLKCQKCNALNKYTNTFCIKCGHEFPKGKKRFKSIYHINVNVYCLNCGRPVKSGQTQCVCGYEFKEIKCPKCNTLNEYSNKYCTSCHKMLWREDLNLHKVNQNYFIYNLSDNVWDLHNKCNTVDNYLYEIRSRWEIISPDYCIKCLKKLKPDAKTCSKCGFDVLENKDRIRFIKTIKPYTEPNKRNIKTNFGYFAPLIGESQYEFRKRLLYEFAYNTAYKKELESKKYDILHPVVEEPEPETEPEPKGGYCGQNCIHYSKVIITAHGPSADFTSDTFGVDYSCSLGHSLNEGGFCEDYE